MKDSDGESREPEADAAWLGLAESIADGTPIDWEEEDARAKEPSDARVLRQLKVVSEIAGLHRSVLADAPVEAPGAARAVDASARIAPGSRWGELELREKVGEGSFGEVFRAFDPKLEREVALKLMRGDRAGRAELADSILREGRLLARLHHPNIVTIYGAEEVDGRVGLRMEFLRGKNLEAILGEQGPLSAGEATWIGLELCRALAALHHIGLVHRDVKTQNVIRESMGRIVLMDLGVGLSLEERPSERPALAGTPFYMAPELLDGAKASPSSDLYSLGVLLYRLVAGRFPVEARRLSELKAAHASGEVRLLRDLRSDLPKAFIAVIERCLAHEPSRRYASAGELEDALGRASGMSAEAAAPKPVEGAIAPAMQPASVTTLSPERRGFLRSTTARVLLGAAVVAAAAAIILLRGQQSKSFDIQASVFRIDQGGVSERLLPGAEVKVGDFLGLEVEGSRDLHVYVLTKDDQGESYLLFPLPGFDQANPLSGAMPHHLPGARDGKELYWQVSSAGGRERLLVLASPTRMKDLEAEIAAMPRPEVGGPLAMAYPISPRTVERLRGIGSLGEGPGTVSRERASDIFEEARAVARGKERAHGVWVREIELQNPK